MNSANLAVILFNVYIVLKKSFEHASGVWTAVACFV